MKNRIIAIDFGTCNTYLSQSKDGGPAEVFRIACGGDSMHGIPSAIMYRTKGSNAGTNEFGQEAIYYFTSASPKKIEEYGLVLATNFRPDIDVSEKARQDAICFLNKLLTEANKQNLHINPLEADIIFSVPNEAPESYRACLRDVARKAGWGDVRLLDDAFGVLCYFQDEYSEDVAHEILQDIVLVVNVDEGASGFAIIKDGKIKYSKSDMLMGGRLFDDLFYQWAIDCTQDSAVPVTEELLIKANKDSYWRCIKCRELKESFSNAMVKDKTCAYEEYFMDQYELSLSWDEFVQRARNYRPSQSFMNMTKFPAKTSLDPSRTMDIINWFETEIRKAFEISRIPTSSVGKVLLTGSCSDLPFVRETCQKIFGEEKLIRCLNPFAAISVGMVKYCRIKEAATKKIEALEKGVRPQRDAILQKALGSGSFEKSTVTLTYTAKQIFKKYVIPELNNFAENGGTLDDLEKSLNVHIYRNAADINKLMSPVFTSVNHDAINAVVNAVKNEINAYGITPDELNLDSVVVDMPSLNPASIVSKIGAMVVNAIVVSCSHLPFMLTSIPPIPFFPKMLRTLSWTPAWAAWFVNKDSISEISKYFSNDFANSFDIKANLANAIDCVVDQALAKYNTIVDMERDA